MYLLLVLLFSYNFVFQILPYMMQVRSMTGYGKAKINVKGKQIVAEIKSVNSKQLDLGLRLPTSLREKDIEFI
jgi:hypothetical protein